MDKTLIILYEASQVAKVEELISKVEGPYEILACGADIELLLSEKKVAYRSARSLRATLTPERLIFVKELGEKLLKGPELSFFSYRGVALGPIFMPGLQYYLQRLLYYFDIVASALEQKYARVVLFAPPVEPGPLSVILQKNISWAVPDAARLICDEQAIPCEVVVPGRLSVRGASFEQLRFKALRAAFGLLITLSNLGVRAFVPKKKIRILGSDLWKNIAPLVEHLPDAEFALFDRTEALHIGLRGILKNRMQFVHAADFVDPSSLKKMDDVKENFKTQLDEFLSQNPSFLTHTFHGYNLAPLLKRALYRIVGIGSTRTLGEIEGAFRVIETYKPHVVMVRAGISGQTHFAALCEVARLCGVPSLEVQHGILSVFAGDLTNDPSSEYIAEYGTFVREQLESHNFAPRSHFLDVGSPRFDVYASPPKKKIDTNVFEVLHIGPPLWPGGWNDSYDVVDYFTATAEAVRNIPNVHVTIKLRASHVDEEFLRKTIQKTFGSVPHSVVLFESLPSLLEKVDAVVSCHSTAFFEALLAHKSVVLDATMPIYTALADADLSAYEEGSALFVARNQGQLRDSLHRLAEDVGERARYEQNAERFIKNNFLLSDGKSSERLAAAIYKLAKKQK